MGIKRKILLVGGVRILGIMTGPMKWYFGRSDDFLEPDLKQLWTIISPDTVSERILAWHKSLTLGCIIY